jgi:hypothetical protein
MKRLGSTCLCVALVLFCASAVARPHAPETTAQTPTMAFDDHPAVKRARAFTMWMAVRSDHAQRWMWEARYKEQTSRRQCLDARLSQLHAIERQSRSARQAVEAAVRVDGLTGPAMVRLVNLHDASRAQYRAASRCGRAYSQRVRMKTQYRVRVIRAPALHAVPTVVDAR